MRQYMLSAVAFAFALSGCQSAKDFAADNPVGTSIAVDATCEIGKRALEALVTTNPLSQLVADEICEQFRKGLFAASSVDLGNQYLNDVATLQQVALEDPVQQVELERMRAALFQKGIQ